MLDIYMIEGVEDAGYSCYIGYCASLCMVGFCKLSPEIWRQREAIPINDVRLLEPFQEFAKKNGVTLKGAMYLLKSSE